MATEDQINGLSNDAFDRMASAVRFVESDPRYTLKKRRWGGPVAASSSSGGASLIQFAISSVVCSGDTIESVTGTVTDVGCDATEPSVGDSVDLVDVMSLLVGYPPALIGRTGVAMKQEQAGGGAYPTDCSWVIWNLEAGYVECS